LFVAEHELKSCFLSLKKLGESDFEDLEVKVEKISCEFCEEQFFIPENLNLHVKGKHQSATENEPIKCVLCGKLCKNKKTYKSHLRLLHKEEVIRCKYVKCFAVFIDETSLEEHLQKKHCLIEGQIKPIECKVCKIWISSKYHLKSHMNRLHGFNVKKIKTIKCKFCPESFDNNFKLNCHTRENHKESIECRLNYCHSYFKTNQQMEDHFKKAHQINCKFCHSTFTSKATYFAHLSNLHLDIRCKFSNCAFYSESKVEVENHVKEKHSTLVTSECIFCGKTFSGNRWYMTNHVRQFHSQIAIRCDTRNCGIFFKSQEDLEKHQKEAHKKIEKHKKTVECLYCQKVIWDKQCYALHIKALHSKEAIRCKHKNCCTFFKTEEDLQKHNEEKHAENYCCALCDYKTSARINLQNHFERLHLPKELKCPHCPKLFANKVDLRAHIKYNHKPHEKCPHCKKVGTNLRRHVVTTNCPLCFQPFPCKKLFSDHKLKCKKIHKCRECGETFKIAYGLKHHINLRHKLGQEFKGFECKFCPTFFVDRKSLRTHQLSEHFALMKYKCKFCDEAFTCKSSLQQHRDLKHIIGGFKCKLCDKICCSRRELSAHLQNVHLLKKQMVECADCGKTMRKISFKNHFIYKHL